MEKQLDKSQNSEPGYEAKTGLLPTPPMPADLPAVELTENARQVLIRRYVRRGQDGKPAETVEEMFWRVAYHIAKAEAAWHGDVMARARDFYILLTSKSFFPNSPTFTGAGTPLGQLAACFVLAIADDMGRHPDGIFQTLRNAALIQQTGGGNGFAFSRLRPKGALVNTSAGQATGPVGFLRVYDNAFGEIAQGGCLLPETLVFTSRGLLRLDEMADPAIPGWQEHALQVATDQGWKESPRAYNNGVAPVLRIYTRNGLSLAGTYQHRVKVMTDRGPEWRSLQDLKKGDWLLVKLGEQRGQIQALRQPERRHASQVMPKLPTLLDEELAFFLGYFTGQGFVASREDDHRVGVRLSQRSYLIDEMPALMQRLFGVRANKRQKADGQTSTLVIRNAAVKEFLRLNGLAEGQRREARVPRLVRQSPPEVAGAYLRGLFEANGSLAHGYPQLTTPSARLAEEAAALLVGLGCPVAIRSMAPGIAPHSAAAVYQVRIESPLGLSAWKERIGCDLRSRLVGAHRWQPDAEGERGYTLPCPRYWFQPVLEGIPLPLIGARATGQTFPGLTPPLRRSLLRYLRGERPLTQAAYSRLCKAYPAFAETARPLDGLWFVQVTGIEDAGEALTLDLEVAGNHTYLAYGLVTHNTRRGANMGVLRVDHPDIEEFVTCKTDEHAITNFNISVGITDAFMRAVENDEAWELRFPDITSPQYKGFQGTFEQAEAAGIPFRAYRQVRARDLFAKIVSQAHHNGEPGLLFLDAANRSNPVPHLYQLEATNPCFIGSTRIATSEGLLTIKELAEAGVEFMAATDDRAPKANGKACRGSYGAAFRLATPAWKTREHTAVLRLVTRHGYEVVATPDHLFLTTDRGYVALADLKPGDRLLVQSQEGAWSRCAALPGMETIQQVIAITGRGDPAGGLLLSSRDVAKQYARLPSTWSHRLGLVLGALTGCGWLNGSCASPVGLAFPKEDRETQQAVIAPLLEWFGPGQSSEVDALDCFSYGRAPYEFFKALGVADTPAQEKRVPESIWRAPREAVVGFLQGLFTSAGAVSVSKERRACSVRLHSDSLALLKDVQLLLSNFGIVCRLSPAHARPELIIERASRDLFVEKIGFISSARQNQAVEFILSKSRWSHREAFETAMSRVEPAGSADVYDFTEPATHSMIANALVAHNCGEQFLGPNENCCLGSINLAQHFAPDGAVDWEKLRANVELATIFLDDVVEANAYVPAVPALSEAAHRARRIGLGIMGLADLLYHAGIRYGSPEGQEFASQVMEFVRYTCMQTSVALARQRGPFPAIAGSIYDSQDFRWSPPQPIAPYEHDWGRPEVDWVALAGQIRQVGLRNAAQTTIAPTGTIATVAGCEGYGCEPVFALAYIRHVNDNGRDLQLTYTSPQFEQALEGLSLDPAEREAIVDQVLREGTCQGVEALPDAVRDTFVVSADISAEEHVRTQASLQAFVDNSLSKTINFPAGATEDDVATAYRLAWKLGCKGITVYVTGSRDVVVLETHATADKKQAQGAAQGEAQQEAGPETLSPETRAETAPLLAEKPAEAEPELKAAEQLMIWHEAKRPRPRVLPGYTFNIQTPLGKTFVTVNENGGQQPFEVFITCAKAGSDTAAVSDAIGRLISYVLRLASPVEPKQRLVEVVRQLQGIGGGRPMGFGPNRVRSLPDGVSQVLADYLANWQAPEESVHASAPQEKSNGREVGGAENFAPPAAPAGQPTLFNSTQIGDLCPECGQAAVINEEGCRKCYACGYSEC